MAYYSGSAVDMAAVRTALVDACTSKGWSWDVGTEMLSKGAAFLRLQVAAGYLTLQARTSASSGAAPGLVRIGNWNTTDVITWPVSYDVFVFEAEVYLVIQYSIDNYQWAAFGVSTVLNMPGSGMWVGASQGDGALSAGAYITIGPASSASGVAGAVSPALFWGAEAPNAWQRNYWIHSDLDGAGWLLGTAVDAAPVGISALVPLMAILPNSWNSEAVMLPIRGWKVRASSKISLTADLVNARYTRMDNYEPGQIVAIGDDQWKLFPWHRKNSAARNGGTGINHTGTLGWALRYERP